MEQLSHLKNKYDRYQFIIGDLHQEYPLPGRVGSVIWDGHRMDDILMMVKNTTNSAETTKQLDDMFKKVLEYLRANEHHAHWDHYNMNEPWTALIELTFFDEQEIIDFYEEFKASVVPVIEDASGDDDFFDYAPNYVDMFEQFAHIIGKYDDAREHVQGIINASPHDAELLSDAFGYRKQ